MEKTLTNKKIYLAGSCATEHRNIMVNVASFLRAKSFDVFCPFELKLDEKDENGNWTLSQEDWAQQVFEHDKAAIDAADIFLMISPGRVSTAGTNWEQGYAYANNKLILVFQYTEEKTSIMTYCTANEFINVNSENIIENINNVINYIKLDKTNNKLVYTKVKDVCKTIYGQKEIRNLKNKS